MLLPQNVSTAYWTLLDTTPISKMIDGHSDKTVAIPISSLSRNFEGRTFASRGLAARAELDGPLHAGACARHGVCRFAR